MRILTVNNKINDDLAKALEQAMTESRETKPKYTPSRHRTTKYLETLDSIGVEGDDHINMDMSSQLLLGKALDLVTPLPFTDPVLGKFTSIEGFRCYIIHRPLSDEFRNGDVAHLRKARKGLTPTSIQHYKALIMHSIYYRIEQCIPLKEAFIDSTLPFDCYGVDKSGGKYRRHHTGWLVPFVTILRQKYQSGKPFNITDKAFAKWWDSETKPDSDIYGQFAKDIMEAELAKQVAMTVDEAKEVIVDEGEIVIKVDPPIDTTESIAPTTDDVSDVDEPIAENE